MNKHARRAVIGLLAGGVGSVMLAATLDNALLGILLGVLVGAGYALAFRLAPRAYVDSGMTAAVLGVPLWVAGDYAAVDGHQDLRRRRFQAMCK